MKHINLNYINTLADGNNEVIIELINLFKDQIPEFKERMTVSLENKDWSELHKIAHKAKSSLNIMGMKDTATELETLEHMSKKKETPEKYPTIVQHFLEIIDIANEELDVLLAEM